jgi:virulence-associated protein VapD
MKNFLIPKVGFSLLFILLITLGCRKESVAPPEPLTVEQLPSAMEKAFSKAPPAAKDLAAQIVAAVQTQDYPKAFLDIQSLLATQGLTREQGSVSARAMMAINGALKSAVVQGDTKSAAALKHYKMTK